MTPAPVHPVTLTPDVRYRLDAEHAAEIARVRDLWNAGKDTLDIARALGIHESQAVYLLRCGRRA